MKHIVKIASGDMSSPTNWDILIKQLDPSVKGTDFHDVELTVETVFFTHV